MTHKDLMLCLLAMLATLGCSGRSAPTRESAAFGGLEYGGDSYGSCTDDSCSVCGGFWNFDSDSTSDDQTSPPDAGSPDACVTPDAGESMDAGEPMDAGGPMDPGGSADAAAAAARARYIRMAAVPPDLIIDILEDGTAVIRDAAGKIIDKYPKAAQKVAGQWIWDFKGRAPSSDLLKRCKLGKIAKCAGVIGTLLLLSDLAYAGMDVALGPAAGQIGVRLQDCQDRFAKAIGGIACLNRQAGTTTCAQAVQSCPDAFFGANLNQSCGTEPGMDELIAALVAAIERTSARGGGWGYLSPDPAHLIADAIRQGRFATSPEMTCTMRPRVQDCAFVTGDVFPSPAGFDEAKTCWENASRGILESKWTQAYNCCTTDACRAFLGSVKNC